MKKILILAIILIMPANFYSCSNITIADFTPHDIGIIMNFLFFNDDDEYDSYMADATAADEYIAEIAEEINEAGYEQNAPRASDISERTEPALPQPVPPPAEPAPNVIIEEPALTDDNAASPPPEMPAQESEHPQVRTDAVFEDAPPIFRRTPFPENLIMTDTLKQAIRNLEPLASRNFRGETFYLMTTNPILFTPPLGGGYLSDMRSYRTSLVQTACRIQIGAIPADTETEDLALSIERRINAGEYIADALVAPLEIQSRLAEKGLLLNLRRIPFINLRAEHYNQSAIEAATINGNVYSLISDALFDPNTIYAMFYNRDLIRRHNLTSPAELQRNNAWTYQSIFEIGRELSASAADFNGDYLLGFDKERSDIINGMFIGAGKTFFDIRPNDYPVLNFNNAQTRSFTDALAEIFLQPELNFLDSENQRETFMQSNVLFSVSTLDIIPAIAEIDFDWGILPMPTLDGGGVRSFVSSNSLSLSVLRGTPNTELSGFITEALSVASHKILRETYISEQLMYTLRDVHSVRVLNDIINNVTYNQHSIYGTIGSIHDATVGVLKETANRRGDFEYLYENARDRLLEFFDTAPVFFRR